MKNTDYPENDILRGEINEIFKEIAYFAGLYSGWTSNENKRINELLAQETYANPIRKQNIYAEIASLFPRYRTEFAVTKPHELLGSMPVLGEDPFMRERVKRFVWLNIWQNRYSDTLAEKLSDERTLALRQLSIAIAKITWQLQASGDNKNLDKPIDFGVFTKLFGTERMAEMRENYIITKNGISTLPTEEVLLKNELIECKNKAADIKLNFPCSYAEIKTWAVKNGLIDALMSSELIAGTTSQTPLTKADKVAQEVRIERSGPPTVSLRCFVDDILAEELENHVTLPTFYVLVEDHGLVVYDGVIDSKIVSSDDLLLALRHRELEVDKGFGDDDWYFWKPFLRRRKNVFIPVKKLSFVLRYVPKNLTNGDFYGDTRYTIFRKHVARAYYNAGMQYFPWIDLNENKIQLKVEENIMIDCSWEFGTIAKPEDYQKAFKQDTWSWQEALCWLKGRLPDIGRLHQLSMNYQEEADLINRAIKAGHMTADSTPPQQWLEWAKEKGWTFSPLLEQYLHPVEVSENKEDKLETSNVNPRKSERFDDINDPNEPTIAPVIKIRKCKNETDGLVLLNTALDEMEKRDKKTPSWMELAAYVLSNDFKHSNIRTYGISSLMIKNRKLVLNDGTVIDRQSIRRRYKETIFP